MEQALEKVRQARDSFGRILQHKVYMDVIRDDRHLSLLLELVQGGGYKRILDIGTGMGYLAFPLAAAYSDAQVYGIDIAESIIDKNRERVREDGIVNLIFRTFDGIHYPFEEGSFDLIVSRYAFHHFPDPGNEAGQIGRLLAPGGRVLISDPVRAQEDQNGVIDTFMRIKKDGHIRFYTETELEQLFAEAGLHQEKQTFTHMAFPFAPNPEYAQLYRKITDRDRRLYDMAEKTALSGSGTL